MKSHRALTHSVLLIISLVFNISTPSQAQLQADGAQFWNHLSPGLFFETFAFDGASLGLAIAAGDFDCNGFDDLAIGIPSQLVPTSQPPKTPSIGSRSPTGLSSKVTAGTPALDAGQLLILYSAGAAGLASAGHQVWDQDSSGIEDQAEPGDRFGSVLAAGNFNGDDCDDLAIGIPLEDVSGDDDAGAVSVLYGSDTGLTAQFDDFWFQDLTTLTGVSEPGDRFGSSLAVGDFNNDSVGDLAIGSPGESIGSVAGAGMVHVLFGTVLGLGAGDSVALWRGNGLNQQPQIQENLGSELAAGQFTGLPGEELAIGAPGRNLPGDDGAGVVILVSDVDGAAFSSEWSQDSDGVPGVAEELDRFGSVLAAGDFDGNGFDELAVGVPLENTGNPEINHTGVVNILQFDGNPHQIWFQDELNPETGETGDRFGAALAAADYDGDGIDDLAIGAPEESLGPGEIRVGILHVLHGAVGNGLTDENDQLWPPLDIGTQAQFGFSLAAGHFTGRPGSDLAIGAPFDAIGVLMEAGSVSVLLSADILFQNGFETGNTGEWSSTVP